MATIYADYGKFESWATKIKADNDKMNQQLADICKKINSLEATYQSNASKLIREKITAMKPKNDNYYKVIDAYARFVSNTGASYRAVEEINVNDAEKY